MHEMLLVRHRNMLCNALQWRHLSTYKLVLVVRQDIKMSKGKTAAQCAHAAVLAYKSLNGAKRLLWEAAGQPKLVLKCPDEAQLTRLASSAKNASLPAVLVRDAGRTELESGTVTVLGVGPAPSNKIDLVTGELKLL